MCYLDSPDGLKQCKVVIFDKLSDFQSCNTSVPVLRAQLYAHARPTELGKCVRTCDSNHPTILLLQETRNSRLMKTEDIPLLAFKNLSVMSWIFGSGAQTGCLNACLNGRLVCGVALVMPT